MTSFNERTYGAKIKFVVEDIYANAPKELNVISIVASICELLGAETVGHVRTGIGASAVELIRAAAALKMPIQSSWLLATKSEGEPLEVALAYLAREYISTGSVRPDSIERLMGAISRRALIAGMIAGACLVGYWTVRKS